MLIPQIINKTKFGYENGKVIVAQEYTEEETCEYNINDFTDDALKAIIKEGHMDYFTDAEQQVLKSKGLVKQNPQLAIDPNPSSMVAGMNSTAYTEFSRLGDGTVTTDSDDVSIDVKSKTLRFFQHYTVNYGDQYSVNVSVAETDEYESATVVWVINVDLTGDVPNPPISPDMPEPPVVEPELPVD